MIEDIRAEFERLHELHFLKDEAIQGRKDLTAFNLLDKLVPGTGDIISSAEHDEFFIGIPVEELAKVATPQDIEVLVRCGVIYNEDYDCLMMFA